jgi:hypothetical protein
MNILSLAILPILLSVLHSFSPKTSKRKGHEAITGSELRTKIGFEYFQILTCWHLRGFWQADGIIWKMMDVSVVLTPVREEAEDGVEEEQEDEEEDDDLLHTYTEW